MTPERAPAEAKGVYKKYTDSVRILEFSPDPPASGPWYWFDAPQHELVEFKDEDLAELYAAVYFAVDAFREENTGRKGIPLSVALDDRAVIATYLLAAWDGTSMKWLERQFGVEREQINKWIAEVKDRAAEHEAL